MCAPTWTDLASARHVVHLVLSCHVVVKSGIQDCGSVAAHTAICRHLPDHWCVTKGAALNSYTYVKRLLVLNLDGVLQFYEYGVENYPSPSQAVRYEPAPLGLQPAHEILSLSDYRRRHALYRMDRGLQVSIRPRF